MGPAHRAYALVILGVVCFVQIFPSSNAAAVMSVDLGSEWMKVGVVSPGVPMEIALNKESKRKTASVVGFKDGIRSFGEDAQNIGVRFPPNSYGYLIDLLGKTIDNPIVDLYKKRFPYYTIEGDPKRNTVVFVNGDVRFSVEELIAQLLQTGKEYAEETAQQPISECVITVPGYFGQAERLAMLSSASLANLKVLQLMNDYTAVALNYGVFQRKEINETASYYVFYDMGAYKTTASVISYQLVKDKLTKEMTPVVTVMGVAFDRTLGGLEMQLRLRDHLAKEFNAMKKTKTDVFTNNRALAKLFKEAGRVKNVLSANAEIYAQIEGLLDEKDFKLMVTRDTFEALCSDLFDRVPKVLENAIKASGLSLDLIKQVVLFGGNTRVPKVQDVLREMIGKELAKNLNSDEAATMGSVYKAADLGVGFKVKKYITKDAVVFPIQVTFEKESTDESDAKLMRRTLFGEMNPYPQKKVITFNKHSNDFTFFVNYAVQGVVTEGDIKFMGSLNLTEVKLTNVKKIFDDNTGEKAESKGIKAHFLLDDSGVFSVVNVELVVEKTVAHDEEEAQDAFSIIGSTISKLFSGEKTAENEDSKVEDEKKEETADKPEETGIPSNATEGDSANKNATAEEVKSNKTEPKIKIIKSPIPIEVHNLFTVPLEGENYAESKKKIDAVDEEDKKRSRRENSLNALESFVVDAVQKLDQKEYKVCATEEEANKIREECSKISDWLYEDGAEADAATYDEKLRDVKKLTNDVFARHWEHQERPEAVKALNGLVEKARIFWKTSKNFTKDTNAEMDVFTIIEVETLEKLIVKTEEWVKTETVEQKKLKSSDAVRMTVASLVEKMEAIDRELKYMANKMKIWKPKVEKKTKNETKTEEVKIEGEQKEEQIEEPIVEEVAEEEDGDKKTTEIPEEDDATPRGEL